MARNIPTKPSIVTIVQTAQGQLDCKGPIKDKLHGALPSCGQGDTTNLRS